MSNNIDFSELTSNSLSDCDDRKTRKEKKEYDQLMTINYGRGIDNFGGSSKLFENMIEQFDQLCLLPIMSRIADNVEQTDYFELNKNVH